jgi:predicted phage terminase large subunit-like protein
MNRNEFLQQQKVIEFETDKSVLREHLQSNLYFFVCYRHFFSYNAHWKHSWYYPLICDHLEAVFKGDIKKLMINQPPSTGKSALASVCFPAYVYINNPASNIYLTSFSDELVAGFSNQIKQILTANNRFEVNIPDQYDQYRKHQVDSQLRYEIKKAEYEKKGKKESAFSNMPTFVELFPEFQIGNKNTERFWTTTANGNFYAQPAGGQITGRHAGSKEEWNEFERIYKCYGLLITDDLHDSQKVESDVERRKSIDWYTRKFISRKATTETPEVIIGQRVHEDDICGTIIRNDDEGLWTVLSIPALMMRKQIWMMSENLNKRYVNFEDEKKIAEIDPAFGDEKVSINPLIYSLSTLEYMKRVDPYMFAGQMMQRPAPEEGGIFKQTMIIRYNQMPAQVKFKALFIDTAHDVDIHNDRTAFGAFYHCNDNLIYCVEGFAERLEEWQSIEKLYELHDRHHFNAIYVEHKSIGSALVQRAKKERLLPIFYFEPKDNKILRAKNASLYLQNYVRFPNTLPGQQPWVDEMIYELLNFPNASHDDYVDVLSSAVLTLANNNKIFYTFNPQYHCVVSPYMPSHQVICFAQDKGTTIFLGAEVTNNGQIRFTQEHTNIDGMIPIEQFVNNCMINNRMVTKGIQYLSTTVLQIDNEQRNANQTLLASQKVDGFNLADVIQKFYRDYPVRYIMPKKEHLFECCKLVNEQFIKNIFIAERHNYEPGIIINPNFTPLLKTGLEGGFALKQKCQLVNGASWELEELSPYYQECYAMLAIINYCFQNYYRQNSQFTQAKEPVYETNTLDVQMIDDYEGNFYA